MTRFPWGGTAGAALALLAACGPAVIPEAPVRADLAAEVVLAEPKAETGVCWAHDTLPAVIETVTEQVVDRPAATGKDGKAVPASYRTETHQKMIRDRSEVWFRTPCAQTMDVDLVATVQRALKARGYYRGALTGRMDKATRSAVRRFQAARGLDSSFLSLAAAQDLGVVVTPLDLLERKDKGRRAEPAASSNGG
ncbi:MAG: peptidoglycan-binding domain-containing protein [Paracoccaceae bacterium]